MEIYFNMDSGIRSPRTFGARLGEGLGVGMGADKFSIRKIPL